MKVRFTTSVAGKYFAYRYGEEVEGPHEMLAPFLASGSAELVTEERVETPERRVQRPEVRHRARNTTRR